MKYHNHEIVKIKDETIDKEMSKDQCYYAIQKDGKLLGTTILLSGAKDFIDSNYNETYLV